MLHDQSMLSLDAELCPDDLAYYVLVTYDHAFLLRENLSITTFILQYYLSQSSRLKWPETKNLKLLIIDNDKTLHNHRTWKYITKTEAEIFVTVIVSK